MYSQVCAAELEDISADVVLFDMLLKLWWYPVTFLESSGLYTVRTEMFQDLPNYFLLRPGSDSVLSIQTKALNRFLEHEIYKRKWVWHFPFLNM